MLFLSFCLKLMFDFQQTCAGAVMLTDIVFWCILVPFLLGEQFHLTLVSVHLYYLSFYFHRGGVFTLLQSFFLFLFSLSFLIDAS
jgi:hypothetical protein